MEYMLIDLKNHTNFNKQLGEMYKDGWNPWMNHVIYIDSGGDTHYTIMLMKSPNVVPQKN